MQATTWSTTDKHANVVLSNADFTEKTTSAAGFAAVRSAAGVSTGKWYWEYTIIDTGGGGSGIYVGIAKAIMALGNYPGAVANASGWGYSNFDGNIEYNGTDAAYGNSYANGDVISVALDMDNGKVWFAKNGTWQNSGDPAAGTNPASSAGISGNKIYACTSAFYVNDGVTANFGATAFAYPGLVPNGFTAGLGETVSIFATFPLFQTIVNGHDDLIHVLSSVSFPLFTTSVSGTVSSLAPQPTVTLSLSLPAIRGSFYGGGMLATTLGKSSFASTGYTTISGVLTASIALPFTFSGLSVVTANLAVAMNHIALSQQGSIALLGKLAASIILPYASTGLTAITGAMSLPLALSMSSGIASILPHGDGTFSINFGFYAEGSQTSYRSMVLNLKNQALTEYLNYNFNSMASFDGKYYGANSAGIYELTGTQDVTTDIPWRIVTPRFDLETDGVKKKLSYVWLGGNPSGDLLLTVTQPDGTEYEYLAQSIDIVDGGIRIKFGKGIKSRYVDLELSNQTNESLTLDKLRIFVEPTTKKR